jgi:hypothetical protein
MQVAVTRLTQSSPLDVILQGLYDPSLMVNALVLMHSFPPKALVNAKTHISRAPSFKHLTIFEGKKSTPFPHCIPS